MRTLICGSFAFDTIMVFEDQFKRHILPDKIHILNVSFQVPGLRREFGGTAGNIAYNLKLLGGEPLPMGTAGRDFGVYAAWLDSLGIDQCHVRMLEDQYTAQAYIITDHDDNQITAFHPGAMNSSHLNSVPAGAGIELGIVSPDGGLGMMAHARQFHAAGIPFVFDPGQAMPLFDGAQFREFLALADWVAVNDYEGEVLQERTGLTAAQIALQVRAYIVTRGAEGSRIYTGGQVLDIPPAPASEVLDPTGCGDAFRGGLLYGLAHNLPWEVTGRIASLMGAIKIASRGAQNHRFTPEEFRAIYRHAFGSDMP
jgi:adenosine kinase